ncbi:MAG TPA: SGNH/GDSL hydrolase family protein, partial [Gaiellaceae bacterium]
MTASSGGSGALASRLRSRDCTIAYMGASVTAQKDGYRPRLHELLRAETGRDHTAVACAIGATGSITGVFLMDELVLPRSPDIAFVEYTTSDAAGTTPPVHLETVLDGMFGKLVDAGCLPCVLHLYRRDHGLDATHPLVQIYARAARRYGVPSINVATYFAAAIRAGELDVDAILRDVVHTTALGSDLAASFIVGALDELSTT